MQCLAFGILSASQRLQGLDPPHPDLSSRSATARSDAVAFFRPGPALDLLGVQG